MRVLSVSAMDRKQTDRKRKIKFDPMELEVLVSYDRLAGCNKGRERYSN